MNVLSQIAALVAGAFHVLFFLMESLFFSRPPVHSRFGTRRQDVAAVRPWAFNQGWYNLFLAAGAIGGVAAVWAGAVSPGRAVALFACACMAGAATVLVGSDVTKARAALLQGAFPVVALVASMF